MKIAVKKELFCCCWNCAISA